MSSRLPEENKSNESRIDYFKLCWEHSRGHKANLAIMIFAAAWGILTTYGPLVDLPFDVQSIPKMPLTWTLLIILAGMVFVLIEGGYRFRNKTKAEVERFKAATANAAVWHQCGGRLWIIAAFDDCRQLESAD
jgi:hypothetical protein